MGLALDQDIKTRPEQTPSWSLRRLFPVKAIASAISKTMTSLFDFVLAYLVLVISLAELIGHRVSWFMWVFTFVIFLAALSERNKEKSKPHDDTKHTGK